MKVERKQCEQGLQSVYNYDLISSLLSSSHFILFYSWEFFSSIYNVICLIDDEKMYRGGEERIAAISSDFISFPRPFLWHFLHSFHRRKFFCVLNICRIIIFNERISFVSFNLLMIVSSDAKLVVCNSIHFEHTKNDSITYFPFPQTSSKNPPSRINENFFPAKVKPISVTKNVIWISFPPFLVLLRVGKIKFNKFILSFLPISKSLRRKNSRTRLRLSWNMKLK